MKVKLLSHVRLFVTPWTVACTRLLHPWDFLGKSTGVGCHFLLQGMFLTQGLNPGLRHCRQTLYRLSHQGSFPPPNPGVITVSTVLPFPQFVWFSGGSDGKSSVYNVGDLGSIPGLGRFPGEGNGNPLQYSCLENPMDGGAWCRLLAIGSLRVRHD